MKTFFVCRFQTGLQILLADLASCIERIGKFGNERLALILASPVLPRRRWIRLFGLPGVAAAGLLIGCLSLYFSAIRPVQSKLADARQSVIEFRGMHSKVRRETPPAEQLAVFYRTFPDEKNLPSWLEKIFTMAHDQGISLDQGEYKVTSDRMGKLMRYQMTLPVKGEYPQIRKYLDSLLAEIPIVSLEHLQFERQKVGDPVIEAKIRLALYLEPSS